MEYRIRVVPVAEVRNPYGIAFVPGGDMLVTQMIGGMVRDVREGPDGLLYFATVADPLTSPGSIMRIEPAGRPN